MRRNSDVESFQEVFDPETLIQRENRLPRLVRILSFPADSAISVGNISEHCNKECGLSFPISKYESSLSDLASNTSAFDFPCISWSPWTSEPLGSGFLYLLDLESPLSNPCQISIAQGNFSSHLHLRLLLEKIILHL